MTKTTETQAQYTYREHMARKLSNAYDWDLNELMQMPWADLHERYLDYIYGV